MNSEEVQTTTLLFETSPLGNVDAIVEHDGRAVYFYLNGRDTFGVKACWVRNLIPGPITLSQKELREGIPPVLPRPNCSPTMPAGLPDEASLHVVWFEEGNGCALLEQDQILAIIPPWSGVGGFFGYARDCCSVNTICWPLPAEPHLAARIDQAKQFWRAWEHENVFGTSQPKILNRYESRFGPTQRYFAIDGGNFPPRGLAEFHPAGQTILATVGMSLFPQPNVELAMDEPSLHHRIELAVALDWPNRQRDADAVAGRISSLAALPWREWTWLGHGHTCEFAADLGFPIAVMAREAPSRSAKESWALPRQFGDPVSLIWLIPIDRHQAQTVLENPTLKQRAIDQFMEKMN